MAFAEKTQVSPEKSRNEIETILKRYGATGFCYGWESYNAVIMFIANDRHIRFILPLPNPKYEKFTHKDKWNKRTELQVQNLVEQTTRQKWRALTLAIKAKLESVNSGITTFENEFLAHVVLPNGKTVGDTLKPQLEESYSSGKMPQLLLGASH